jgi:hypothetical protein
MVCARAFSSRAISRASVRSRAASARRLAAEFQMLGGGGELALHADQLRAQGAELGQGADLQHRRCVGGGLQDASIGGEHRGVQRIGLGQLAAGAGEGAHAGGVEHRDGQAPRVGEGDQRTFVAAGGFHAEVGCGGQPARERGQAGGVIGHAQSAGGQVAVEVELAHVDADVNFLWG